MHYTCASSHDTVIGGGSMRVLSLVLGLVTCGAPVARAQARPATVSDRNPEWSPDSRSLLYQSNRDGKFAIYTGRERQLTDGVATRQDALADSLIALERRSWEAWKTRDSAFFRGFLSDDHVEVGFGGVEGKATVVAGVGSPLCVVTSYEVRDFAFHRLGPTVALLTYHAAQQTTCGGRPVPSPVWVSSLYVLRDGRWLNAAYQQTQSTTG
jgi:Domain of unknown function (DUF4440)/WD40-like Beta Propeller Repeat